MIDFNRFRIALVIALAAMALTALIAAFLALQIGIERTQQFSSTSLFSVLFVALIMIIGGTAAATGVQAIFTRSSPPGSSNFGNAFQQNLRVFAWIVGSISASYTVVTITIAERLIDALLSSG